MVAKGLIKNLKVIVQGHQIVLPVYLLPVAGADLVLGASWLATLGPHVADYASLSLKFYLNGTFITLHGDKTSTPTQAHFHHIKRLQHTKAISELFTIQMQPTEVPHDMLLDLPDNIELELAILLHTYRTIFQQPSGLPPTR